jgi:hypothetical protein
VKIGRKRNVDGGVLADRFLDYLEKLGRKRFGHFREEGGHGRDLAVNV